MQLKALPFKQINIDTLITHTNILFLPLDDQDQGPLVGKIPVYKCVACTPPAAGLRPSVGPVAASGSQSLQWHAPWHASPWGQSFTPKCFSLASYNASQPYGLQPPHPKGSWELTSHQTQMLGVSFPWASPRRSLDRMSPPLRPSLGSQLPLGYCATWACGNGQWWVGGSQACVVLGSLLSPLFSLWAPLWLCMWGLIYQAQSLSVQQSEALLKEGEQVFYFLNVQVFIIEEGI